MRQAGRYLKQYRQIRDKHGILEICKRPDLAATVTLQPVEMLDVDAAIIFADLLLPVEPMGLKLRYEKGEGPVIDNPVRTSDDVDSLSTTNTDDLGYVGQAIQNVVRALAGRVPVIGFVGAPFTMASYMIEGGASRNFIRTKKLMYSDETLWRRLMGKIVDVLAPFAHLQVTAGARAIQVFDSWVGALGSDDYVRFAAPYSRALIERIRSTGVPVIHFGTGASGFFRELHAAGGDVMGVDWRINIDQAWMDISYRSAIQGNLDPVALFAPLPELRTKVHELLKRTGVAARPHLQPGPRHSARDPGGERQGRGGDGPGIPPMKQGVLLLAHGAPERVEDVESYLTFVRGGRPASPQILEEVTQPLPGHRRIVSAAGVDARAGRSAGAHARACRSFSACATGIRSFGRPWTGCAMPGVERMAAIAMAPQYSELSVGLYIRRTEEAAREAGVAAEIVWARSFHDEPLLIEAFAEKLEPLAAGSEGALHGAQSAREGAGRRRPVRPRNARHGRGGGGAPRAGGLGFRLPEPGPYRRPLAGAYRGILPGPLCRRGHPRSGG